MFVVLALGLLGAPLPVLADAAEADQVEEPEEAPESEVVEGLEPARTDLNLLGEVDAESGEARRNENVRITLIDNNVLRELNVRMGVTATLIDEMQIEDGYYGSEYGGSPARPPFAAVGSAGRKIHGELRESHENSFFQARSFFQVGDVQPARANDYGASVNLPLWPGGAMTVSAGQNKMRGNVNGNVLVPRLDERTPLATDPQTRALVESIFSAYPLEAPNRTDINPRALNTNSTQEIDNNSISGDIQQNIGDDDTVILRYGFTGQRVDAFQLTGGQNPNTFTLNHRAGVTWTHLWSPRASSDFFTGFERTGSVLTPDETALPFVTYTGFVFDSLGPGSDIPIDRAQNTFRQAARTRQQVGNHNLTYGAELARQQINGFESDNHRGSFSFGNDFGNDAVTNVRLGLARTYTQAFGNVHRGFRFWQSELYLGDSWRARPGLTLDMGLRYEPVTAPAEVNGLSERPYECNCDNLAPRFGFAWGVGKGLGVIRASYGLDFGEIYTATFSQMRFNPPQNFNLQIQTPYLADPLRGIDVENLAAGRRSILYRLDPQLATPYVHHYGLTWQFQLPRDWQLDLGYVGSRAHKLLAMWYTNRAQPTEGIALTTATVNERRADPSALEIRRVLNASRAYYDAGKVEVTAPRFAGVTLQSSYWFSKSIDLGSSYTNKAAGRDAQTSRAQSEFNVHEEQKAWSDFDQTHAFLANISYDTPALSRAPGWLRTAFGSWQLGSVVLFKTGTPFRIISGSDGPGFGNVDGTFGDRPDIVQPEILGRSISHPDTSAQLMPLSAFAFIEPGRAAGTLGRNVFRKDGISNWNASVSRRWPLGGDKSLLVQAESLNLSNTPQFAEPGRTMTAPDFGQITNTLNDGRTVRLTARFAF